MIAVIADDLTGAAELAGVGLSYGLQTEVDTVVNAGSKAQLLIIATDTRALPAAEAREISGQVTRQLMALHPQLIYKKIDSVLRGHVLEEIESQLEATGLTRALIVPGNPSHDKKIVDGIYYYQEEPVHQSSYANDPGFPVVSSHVRHMLRADAGLHLLKTGEMLPEHGIAAADITSDEDFNHWVQQLDGHTLAAGAAGLFNSLLQHITGRGPVDPALPENLGTPKLFVFGSTFNQGNYDVKGGLFNGIPLAYLPEQALTSTEVSDIDTAHFAARVSDLIKQSGKAIIAINADDAQGKEIDPNQLAQNMAALVKAAVNQSQPAELLIEGGSTAAAIINTLGITQLSPEQQIAPGVMRMRVSGDSQLYITLKPGSYTWPDAVWN